MTDCSDGFRILIFVNCIDTPRFREILLVLCFQEFNIHAPILDIAIGAHPAVNGANQHMGWTRLLTRPEDAEKFSNDSGSGL